MSTSVQLFSATEKKDGSLKLDVTLPSGNDGFNEVAYACSIRVLRNHARQATSSSKSRGEVKCSTKKPWKQKGTGRARVGAASSPIWRSGGIIFGPRPGCRRLKLNRNVRQQVLSEIAQGMLNESRVASLDLSFKDGEKSLTKKAHASVHRFDGKRVTLFVPSDDAMTRLAFRNISSVQVISFDSPNAFDLSRSNTWLFLKKDQKQFEEMVNRWI